MRFTKPQFASLIVLLFASLAQASTEAALTDGLVAYYPFSGDVHDASAHGNDGTVNDAVLTTDRFGTPNSAFHFNPDVNSQIDVADSASLNFGGPFSVSLWFRFNQPWTYHSESLIYQAQWAQQIGWEINVNQDDSRYGAGMYGIQFIGNSSTAESTVSYTSLTAWNQAVGVFDGSVLSLYVNGALVSSEEDPAVTHATVDMAIGGSVHPVSGAYSRDIDDVRVYNRALSSDEITTLYQAEMVPEPNSSVILTVGLLGLLVRFIPRQKGWP